MIKSIRLILSRTQVLFHLLGTQLMVLPTDGIYLLLRIGLSKNSQLLLIGLLIPDPVGKNLLFELPIEFIHEHRLGILEGVEDGVVVDIVKHVEGCHLVLLLF